MRLFFTLVLLVLTSSFVFAKKYEVCVNSTLNVRSGAGKNCKVIAKLNYGNLVEVDTIIGDWAKLSTGGFVSSKYLIEPSPSSGKKRRSDIEYFFLILLGFGAAWGFFALLRYIFNMLTTASIEKINEVIHLYGYELRDKDSEASRKYVRLKRERWIFYLLEGISNVLATIAKWVFAAMTILFLIALIVGTTRSRRVVYYD